VSEVIAHVVAAEGKHGHRVTAKFADFSGGGGGGFGGRGSFDSATRKTLQEQSYNGRNSKEQ